MDLRTLFLAQTCALATMAAMLWLGRSQADRETGLMRWRWALTSQALAYLLLGWPGLPPSVAAIGGNAAGALSVVIFFAAIRQFTGRQVDARPLAVFVLVVTFVGGVAGERYALATAFNGFAYAGFEWLNAAALRRPALPRIARVQRGVAACYAAMGLLLPARAIALLAEGGDTRYLDLPALGEAPVYVFGFVYIIVTNLGFLQMCKGRAEAEVRQQAFTDELTGLANRRALDVAVERAIAQAQRQGRPFAVVMADLDRFKAINDSLGHAAGDTILAAFARRLRASLRDGDRAFRYGGEEFCLLLPETDAADARAHAESVRLSIAQPARAPLPALTASFGVTTWREGDGFDSLFGRADRALYRAKRAGRDRVEMD